MFLCVKRNKVFDFWEPTLIIRYKIIDMKRIFSLIVVALLSQLIYSQSEGTPLVKEFVVSNTESGGTGSFFKALFDAINCVDADTAKVVFDLPDQGDVEIPISGDYNYTISKLAKNVVIDSRTYKDGAITIDNATFSLTSRYASNRFDTISIYLRNLNFNNSEIYLCLNANLYCYNCTFKNRTNGTIKNYPTCCIRLDDQAAGDGTNLVLTRKVYLDYCKFENNTNSIIQYNSYNIGDDYLYIDHCSFVESDLIFSPQKYTHLMVAEITNTYFENSSSSVPSEEYTYLSQNIYATARTFEHNTSYTRLWKLEAPTAELVQENEDLVVKGSVEMNLPDTPFEEKEIKQVVYEFYAATSGNKTADKYLGSLETKDGTFEYKVPKAGLSADVTGYSCFATYVFDDVQTSTPMKYICQLSDTIALSDTMIVAGKYFKGKRYDDVGIYDLVTRYYKRNTLCDSFVAQRLWVVPDTSYSNYYVKNHAHGTGDGTSWENAMDVEKFAQYLPVVSNVTFHIAQGVYHHPVHNDHYAYEPFEINKSVTLIGGYPDGIKDGETTNDPALYKTSFSGKYKGEEDINNTLLLKILQSDVDVTFSGLRFENAHKAYESHGDSAVNLTFSKCVFDTITSGSFRSLNSLRLEDCYFHQCSGGYPGGVLQGVVDDELIVNRCTFHDCSGDYALFNTIAKLFQIENSTFVGTSATVFSVCSNILETPRFRMLNNTSVGNRWKYLFDGTPKSSTIEGNLFLDDGLLRTESSGIASANILNADYYANLFITEYEDADESGDNIFSLNKSEWTTLFDGVYDKGNETFTPNIAYHGGFAPTLALKTDTLPNGTEIRFVRDRISPSKDQRGYNRPSNTCMGAYEMCKAITVPVSDTIFVGEKFRGIEYGKAGIVTGINDTLASRYGCDSIIVRSLFVVPDTTVKSYFVKDNGTGDGSDWDHAMGQKDFAFYFENLKTEGVSFYLAGGVYHPVYDGNGSEAKPRYAQWKTSYAANLIGGFDPDSKGTATDNADPSAYPTVLSGDLGDDDELVLDGCDYSYGPVKDNTIVSLLAFHNVQRDISLSGITLKDMSFSAQTVPHVLEVIASDKGTVTLNLSKCRFLQSDNGVFTRDIANLNVDQCEFGYISNYAITNGSACRVTNSTFSNVQTAIFYKGEEKSLDLTNSTFVYCATPLIVNNSSDMPASAKVVNNTFVSCDRKLSLSLNDCVSVDFIGNLFVGSVALSSYSFSEKGVGVQSFKHNVFAGSENEFSSFEVDAESNTILSDPSLLYKEVLDGAYTEGETLFMINLGYNGGYTRTVAMKTNELSDGTSLCFPMKETSVSLDQRGRKRLDCTLAGACEILCSPDTTFTTAYVYVGDTFLDSVYTKIGRHDSIVKNYKTTLGCDSVVSYTLFVKPDSTVSKYYVKMDREGKGDGSSWDDAMNGDDFAAVLPLAPEGVTFYVAEGTYKPIYSYSLSQPSDRSKPLYEIKGSLTIRGGYPATASGEDVPSNPTKYPTIFDGDILGNDSIVETLDADKFLHVETHKKEDNAYYMFLAEGDNKMSLEFDGIEVRNTRDYAFDILNPNKDLKITNSAFSYNGTVVLMPYEGENLEVYNSSFSKNVGTVISMPNATNLTMDSVLFEHNMRKLVDIPGASGEHLDWKVRLNRIYAYANGDSLTEIITSIGHDFALSNSEFKHNRGSFLIYDNTLLDSTLFEDNYFGITKYGVLGFDINGCTFVNNSYRNSFIYTAKHGDLPNHISVTNSTFKNTVSGGFIYAVTDSVNIDGNTIAGSSNALTGLINYLVANISNCDIHDNENMFVHYVGKGPAFTYLNANSIWQNNAETLMDFTSDADSVYISNNTFASNTIKTLIQFDGCRPAMYNNTIIGNASHSQLISAYPANLKLRGNIILGNGLLSEENIGNWGTEVIYSRWSQVDYKNNILPCIVVVDDAHLDTIPDEILTENIFSVFNNTNSNFPEEMRNIPNRNKEILSTLFEGTYDETTGIFTPVLTNMGGLTPVAALRTDKLADGTSIKFPLTETIVAEDQRGESRFDQTCMGSYEIKCSPVFTQISDTVIVGTTDYTYLERNLDTYCAAVGSYYFSDTLRSAAGCDSIVNFALAVRPEKKEGGYYVKIDGTGDGSDWEHAMSPADFSKYLPLVYDGDVFHVAAGKYTSSYENPNLGSCFNINTDVTIIGGYPDTVTVMGTQPNPDFYTTQLTADRKKADRIYVYPNNLGYVSVERFDDNDSLLVVVNGPKNISLFGLTLSGVKSCVNGAVTMRDGGSLDMNRCVVAENNASAVVAENAAVAVNHSEFKHNVTVRGAAFDLINAQLDVKNSAIYENVSMDDEDCQVENASAGVAYLDHSQVSFTNNTIANNWAVWGGVFGLTDSTMLNLTNNTIIGNQSMNEIRPGGSLFKGFGAQSTVHFFGNMIVGNGSTPIAAAINLYSDGYNIVSEDMAGINDGLDMVMKAEDYAHVIDGEPAYGHPEVFLPNVTFNSGYTPTIAIIESMFDGGAVISIPSELRRVDEDQRGMLRKDTSCVGAFEFPTYVNYFVKQHPAGDGTGRDWANAMGDSTFSRYFSIVPAGATFHVAAGLYHPVGDRVNSSAKQSSYRYYSTRPLNVYGGYAPNAKEGAVANPAKYATVLSADFNGDDKYLESADSYRILQADKFTDNSSYVMNITSKVLGEVHLKGLQFTGNKTQFRGCSSALSLGSYNNLKLVVTIDSCAFYKTEVGIFSYVDSLALNACRFDSILDAAVSHTKEYQPSQLIITNSSFTNMNRAVNAYIQMGHVLIQNSTFNNNLNALMVSNSSSVKSNLEVEVLNNTFSASPKSKYGITLYDNSKVKAVGNIFNIVPKYYASTSQEHEAQVVASDYNLYSEKLDVSEELWPMGEHDMQVTPEDLVDVLAGKLADGNFIAESAVLSPENYTAVVEMKFDVLPNGDYVRMPIEEASVKADQIATERLDLTSIGAYEMFSGRDTVSRVIVDTVCLGNNYERRGWSLQMDTITEAKDAIQFDRFVKGKIATDTLDTLILYVRPYQYLSIDEVGVEPTLCHGSGEGAVSFQTACDEKNGTFSFLLTTEGDTTSASLSLNKDYRFPDLVIGDYTMTITSNVQCVLGDTVVRFSVVDRDSLMADNHDVDTIFTSCANAPTSALNIPVSGYHTSIKFFMDDEPFADYDNYVVTAEKNANVTAKAVLELSAIPVGTHTVTAIDTCENTYFVHSFTVDVTPAGLLKMDLVDYTDSLNCGLDMGQAKLHIKAGSSTSFSLSSDKGYAHSSLFAACDSILTIDGLSAGNYTAKIKKYASDCSDSIAINFEVIAPEPLSLELTSNGAACSEGMVKVAAQGGRGSYVYHWTNPQGVKFDSIVPLLGEVSAGDYICVVEDSVGCLSMPDTLSILPNSEDLSELTADTVVKNITCFAGNNGTIEVTFHTDNLKQSVACVVTNLSTKEETKVAGTYEKTKGKLVINTLPVGDFSYEIYYGTEGCRLDTNSIKGNFQIKAKAVPFTLDSFQIMRDQACISRPDGVVGTYAKGWEADYKAVIVNVDDFVFEFPENSGNIFTHNDTTTLRYQGLYPNTYYIQVTDACNSVMKTNELTTPLIPALSMTATQSKDSVVCARATDVEITITVAGGTASHIPFINNIKLDKKDTIVYGNVGKGDYKIKYKLATSSTCPDSVVENIHVAGPDTLAIKYTLTGNCSSSNLIPEVSGECGQYNYIWSDGETNIYDSITMPFETEAGKTYALTVTDKCGCDASFTKSFTVPTADQLPKVSQTVEPESEKCFQGNNGRMTIKPKLSKQLDFALTATVFYGMEGTTDTVAYEMTLDPDGELVTPDNLAPGKYFVITRLGALDCDMGVKPAKKTVIVDTLQPLKIQSDFKVNPMTCIAPNGETFFTVDGWTYTHTATLFNQTKLSEYTGTIEADSAPRYLGYFDVTSLDGGRYLLTVQDICGNTDTASFFVDQYIPRLSIDKAGMVTPTCLNEPNGSLDFTVYGWTSEHTLNFHCGGPNYYAKNLDSIAYDTINNQPVATIAMKNLPAGLWRVDILNECQESFKDSVTMNGIEAYGITLAIDSSKLELTCPYDKDGVVVLDVKGGQPLSTFVGSSTTVDTYWGPTGVYRDSVVMVPDTSYSLVVVYDSVDVEVTYDTTFKFKYQDTLHLTRQDSIFESDVFVEVKEIAYDSIVFHYDTITKADTIYHQMVDTAGVPVFDTIVKIENVAMRLQVEVYGYLDSLKKDPINYNLFVPIEANTGHYKYTDLPAGTYRFSYKSSVEGCTDKFEYDTKITKPANVVLDNDVMPISCSTSEDGVISLAPRRGSHSYSYYVAHDSTDIYKINRLYMDNEDGDMVPYLADGEHQTYQINTLYDQSDIVSISWSALKNGVWRNIDEQIQFPDSTDITEEVYYNSNGDTISGPVFSNTHLEKFWADRMGETFVANAVTISNLAPGKYAALVTDAKECKYHDTFEVKLPERPLQIDSVVFDSTSAICDPTKRQILVYASGGWGEYNFSFSDTITEKKQTKQSDGFRGGEATHYDKNTVSGWGVSQFLKPGSYAITLLDEKGCTVQSKKRYNVKSNFDLHIDSTRTVCPEDPDVEMEIKFVDYDKSMTKNHFTIVEYVSPCRTDTLDDCREYINDTLSEKPQQPKLDDNNVPYLTTRLTSKKLLSKTHGLFVYSNEDHCGTYVQGTVVDTIPIFKSSRKATYDVTCNGLNDGRVELYVSGGTQPYSVIRNVSWNSAEIDTVYKNLLLKDTAFIVTLGDAVDTTYKKDTSIINHYIVVSDNLAAGDYYFTVMDSVGCKSVMGDTATFDEKIVVKQPAELVATFDASVVCPVESHTTGGNIFFQNVKGGTQPYRYGYSYYENGTFISSDDDCATMVQIDKGTYYSRFEMVVTDKNGCQVKTDTLTFRQDGLIVDTYDFWASTWYEFGDVVALIDNCGPDVNFDSVSYTFYRDPQMTQIDNRVKLLDKRLYIYDLDANPKMRDSVYKSKNTKLEVPNSFFEKHFDLVGTISKGQSKHVNFFSFEDATLDMDQVKNSGVSGVLAEDYVQMRAYFKGCEYYHEVAPGVLKLINPNDPAPIDKIGQTYEIISLYGSPNPVKENVTITAHFTAAMDATIRIYHLDGTIDPHVISVKASDMKEEAGEFVYSTGVLDVKQIFGEDLPEYFVVLLTTAHDQKSAILLHKNYEQTDYESIKVK